METIQEFARQACSALANTPMACDQTAAAFQWWHFYLALFVGLVVTLVIAAWRKFIARDKRHPDLPEMEIRAGRDGARTLYLHPRMIARILGHEVTEPISKKVLAQRLRKQTDKRDFFVRVEEIARKDDKYLRKEVLHRVMKIVPVVYSLGEQQVEIDATSLSEIRARNISLDDDEVEPKDSVLGLYDFHIRPTKATDIGYWLTHPSADVRYPIWGAIIAVTVEYSSQIVGAANSLWRTFT